VNNELATRNISSFNALYDDHESGRSSGEEEEGDKYGPDPVLTFTNANAIYKTVTSFC
jgi:hypothetical protein